jgi:hypothetical protein
LLETDDAHHARGVVRVEQADGVASGQVGGRFWRFEVALFVEGAGFVAVVGGAGDECAGEDLVKHGFIQVEINGLFEFGVKSWRIVEIKGINKAIIIKMLWNGKNGNKAYNEKGNLVVGNNSIVVKKKKKGRKKKGQKPKANNGFKNKGFGSFQASKSSKASSNE